MAKRYCSFCGRDESQCSSLFQGLHGELLCGDCVRLMASELTGATTGGKPLKSLLPKPLKRQLRPRSLRRGSSMSFSTIM